MSFELLGVEPHETVLITVLLRSALDGLLVSGEVLLGTTEPDQVLVTISVLLEVLNDQSIMNVSDYILCNTSM